MGEAESCSSCVSGDRESCGTAGEPVMVQEQPLCGAMKCREDDPITEQPKAPTVANLKACLFAMGNTHNVTLNF